MKSPLTPKTDAHFHGPVRMRLFYLFKAQADIFDEQVPVHVQALLNQDINTRLLSHTNVKMLVNSDTETKALSSCHETRRHSETED